MNWKVLFYWNIYDYIANDMWKIKHTYMVGKEKYCRKNLGFLPYIREFHTSSKMLSYSSRLDLNIGLHFIDVIFAIWMQNRYSKLFKLICYCRKTNDKKEI